MGRTAGSGRSLVSNPQLARACFTCVTVTTALLAFGMLVSCSSTFPRTESLDPKGLERLRASCDTLVAQQARSPVFMAKDAAWWQVSFCTRALIAGYEVTGDKRYLRAAEIATDAFEAQQLYNGSWAVYAQGTVPVDHQDSYNLADLGCMTACLSILHSYVSGSKAERYREAHLRYAQFASQHDLGDLAFCNGWYLGKNHRSAYSVATATQATSFAALYEASGDRRFLRRAEQAVRFLLNDWRPDGRPMLHHHASNRSSALSVEDFHNNYYILEALLVTFESTEDEVLKDAIRAALEFYLWGDDGLLVVLPPEEWPAGAGNSVQKSRGMLGILAAIQRNVGPIVDLDQLIQLGLGHVTADSAATAVDHAFTALSLAQFSGETNMLGGRRR